MYHVHILNDLYLPYSMLCTCWYDMDKGLGQQWMWFCEVYIVTHRLSLQPQTCLESSLLWFKHFQSFSYSQHINRLLYLSQTYLIHAWCLWLILLQDIVAATAACEEVKQSGRLKKVLELVLLIGNYMNAGSKKEQTIGFEMSFLNKVCLWAF